MKNKSSVNDIFQSENSSKNKTKTILLLTIVAIILIVTFLIIAWVMTRDNTIESIQLTGDQETRILNQPPYAHNIDESSSSNTSSMANLDPFDMDMAKMSDTPPSSIPNLSLPPLDSNSTTFNLDNDPKVLAKMQELQQKHLEKSKNAQPNTQDSNKISEKAASVSVLPKEITTKEPSDSKNISKETVIKPAIDPTSIKSKEPKKEEKTQTPDSKNVAKASTPVNSTPAKPAAPSEQSSASKPSSNIIEKPQQIENKDNGKAATKGHYIQVGSFAGSVDKNFLNRISKYPYRIKTDSKDGKTVVKYLIGPYSSRVEANRNIQKIKEIQGSAFYVEIK
ncbi:SPOR domain-containing protein [Helicobacter sp. MIT 14-3879]|uniref:SPOR domain-containing protein n=1 Tax=Helicobacter sp. MIT 14-3879 TaxID=2040649 RepID=UPI000E1E4FF4|nr:SPOR domain-containing protein [Helicobacter sp. MIT 14-3879]RDU61232.1 hypothetical protein CQA44_09685 [Helicobacter sp. MIT 14-3879]